MVASGTLAVSVAPQDIDSHSATTSGLNVDVQHLTTSKGIALEDPPMGGVFESVVAILTLIRDSMLGECPFGELAELCARTCRVLEATDDLAGIDETIESLGRTVRRIESGIRQRGDCARDLREHNLDCVIAWREELCEILRVLGGGSGRGSALELSGIHEYVHNPFHLEPDSAPALVTPTSVPSVVGYLGLRG
ncbi:hypothetical protein BJ322DRAFT_280221 [Thelephora terrestris]|uniref:Uncharacterized protein n=1 Tax=Thelephora terrestris TaxID=56493 RepID=A0A9P6H6U4_9AGAM|nr:hypothetical protein BJ322DRAFT_280221 [Thelephora terrestris]